jgi:hypothetical protein
MDPKLSLISNLLAISNGETYCVRAPQCSEKHISSKPLAAYEKNKPLTTISRGRHFRAASDHEPKVEKTNPLTIDMSGRTFVNDQWVGCILLLLQVSRLSISIMLH